MKAERTEPLKVLHVVSGDLWAGAEVQTHLTLSGLAACEGITLECVVLNDGILKARLEKLNIPVTLLDESQHNSLRLLALLVQLLRKARPDIVHVHRVKEHFLTRCALLLLGARTPLVRTVHGLSRPPAGASVLRRGKYSLVAFVDQMLVKKFSSKVIAVSRDLEQELAKSGVRDNVCQIYNAVDTDALEHVFAERGDVRKRYGVADEFWVGTAARLVEVKNLPMLIQAGKHLAAEGVSCRISIFGDGPLKERLQEEIELSGLKDRVVLEGFEEDILPVMKSLDVFVLCSHHEGLPMSLLEAMALGTPVVCTNVGGMAEVIDTGVNGVLVPSDDARALAHALIDLQRDTKVLSSLISGACLTIENEHSLPSAVKRVVAVYEQLTLSNQREE